MKGVGNCRSRSPSLSLPLELQRHPFRRSESLTSQPLRAADICFLLADGVEHHPDNEKGPP